MFARLAISLLAACVTAASSLASGGSVFLLDRFGNHREGNAFHRISAVFFAGGPGLTCGAPGLADGDYFFEITDPAGTVLLSPDPVSERRVRVIGGVIAQYLGTTHVVSTAGPCGGIYVHVSPTLASPYPVSEYKLWLTRVENYDALGGGVFGFDPGRSKSDDFRVISTPVQSIVSGHKFYDTDRDGVWDATEDALGGWRVELYKNGQLDGVTFTDEDGAYRFIRDRNATGYEVRERSPDGFVNDATPGATWYATTARVGRARLTNEYAAGPEFGNVQYELRPLAGRTPEFWSDSLDDDDDDNADDDDDEDEVDVRDELLCPLDPAWRIALNVHNGMPVNLRKPVSSANPNASIFTLQVPQGSQGQSCHGAFANWKSYANKNPHDHAGFLLSRQVAATLLSQVAGDMQGSIFINRNLDGVLVSLEDMLTGVIALLSENGAGQTGPNDPFQDLRHRMQMCTNEFGRINETGDPSAVQVVYSEKLTRRSVPSPYLAVGQ